MKSKRAPPILWKFNFTIMAKKVTSAQVASKALKALKDGRSSARTKSNAGSALSRRENQSK